MAVLAITILGCKKNPDDPKEKPNVNMQDVVLQGIVTDINNNPLGGVQVSTGSTVVATTDSDGRFIITKVGVVNKRAVLKFEKNGYFPLTRSGVKEKEMFVAAILHQKGNSEISVQKTFTSTSSATLEVGNMKVDIPSSAIMKADGKEYSGAVKADMLYLSPDNEKFASMMPGGDLAGVRENGEASQLISYGMSDVIFTDAAGNPLQIKSGTSAKVSFPVPESMKDNPPASMPLWSFDEDKGIWIEEGVFTLEGGVYVGTAKHFSWINCDASEGAVTINGKVVDCNNEPLPNIAVYSDQTAVYTNENGEFSGVIPANKPATICVTFNGVTKVESLPPYPAGSVVTVPTFHMPCMVKIKGKVVDCDKKPIVGIKVSADITAIYTNSKGEYMIIVPEYTPVTLRLPANADSEPVPGQPNGTVYIVRDLVVCDKDPGVGTSTQVEKGSIKLDNYGAITIYTWDNYGKRFRHDYLEQANSKESYNTMLINHLHKTYMIGYNNESGVKWEPQDYDPFENFTQGFSISIDEAAMASFRVYPDATIAGRTCKVFVYKYGGMEMKYTTWNGLIMKLEVYGQVIWEAIDATLNVPESAFTQTFAITWF